eukprot:6128454-Prymnesium_polylepis.1
MHAAQTRTERSHMNAVQSFSPRAHVSRTFSPSAHARSDTRCVVVSGGYRASDTATKPPTPGPMAPPACDQQ